MGYPVKIQHIQRKQGTDQWFINFPTPIAEAMDFTKSEVVEWTVADKAHLVLSRRDIPPDPIDVKKKRRRS